jgi:hypothetical protein
MNYFDHVELHPTSLKLYNTKLTEWILYLPSAYRSVIGLVGYPEFSMKILETNLSSNTPSNRHIFLVSVLSYLRHKKDELPHLSKEEYEALRARWVAIHHANEAPIVQRRLENRPTDIQLTKNGVHLTFDQIVATRDALAVGSIERLLLSLYTMIPPCRADYFATQVVRGEEVPTEKNYVRIHEGVESVLTDFKTARQYKEIRNVFPPALVAELQASLEAHHRSYLFLNAKGEPFNRASFVLWAGRLLRRVMGVDFTLVFFRHAFVTHFFTKKGASQITDGEVKALSDKMGHSTEMFRAYKWVQQGGAVEELGEVVAGGVATV